MSDVNNFGNGNNEQGTSTPESFPNSGEFQNTTGSYNMGQGDPNLSFDANAQFDPNAVPNYSVEPQPDKKGKSIASLVLGICGFLGCCSPIIGLICGILAIIFGARGRNNENAQGQATAGLVLGIITVVISLINWIAGTVILSSLGISNLSDLSNL